MPVENQPVDPAPSGVGQEPERATIEHRYRVLGKGGTAYVIFSTVLITALCIFQLFNLGRHGGFVAVDTQYFFMLLGVLLPLAIYIFPARPTDANHLPFYDWALMVAGFGSIAYLLWYALDIINLGWEYSAPGHIKIASAALWLVVLEGARRAGGFPVFLVVLLLSLYPVYSAVLPAPFDAFSEEFGTTVAYHAISSESVFGVPFRAFANLVVGFLIFGVALQHTGGGKFFLDLAFALMGHVRGGPAKVAILSSGLMGSMSGSVITNVLTTGAMSIPAMKRTGFKPHYAAGVEACASTGGVLMPPIMGATAFVMAIYLQVPYSDVIVAAVIPSFLYFFGLFVQIDATAAREGLKGLPRHELPSLVTTLKQGWYYIFVFALLVWLLLFLQREALAPFYATAMLVVFNQFNRKTSWNLSAFKDFILGIGKLFAELSAVLAGIGMIVGSLSLTGKISTLSNELLSLAGDNVFLLLVMGALASFIMGIGVTVTVAYIILAITLGPALTNSGLNPMAVHLFMMYWGMLSFITPPVALGAFTAASLARANPMRTGFEAMRLGSIIYFIPFFFVFNPALIMQGTPGEIIPALALSIIGVVILSGGLQGYIWGAGSTDKTGPLNWPVRILLLISGLSFMLPGGSLTGFTSTQLLLFGLATGLPALLLCKFVGNRASPDYS